MTKRKPSKPRGDAALVDIAVAVDSGETLDWARARTAAPDSAGILDALELIAQVRQHHASTGSPADLALPDGTPVSSRWGPLRLEGVIGRGSFGTVFRARDTALDRDVALKILHRDQPTVTRRILAEGRRLARLQHPNIVRVLCIDEQDDLVGLRMELVTGRTLHDVVREEGPFDESRAVSVGLDLCRAVAAVHASDIVHRDVKAANAVLADGGRVVLMDLGAGVFLRDTEAMHGVTGTPLYLAPELFDEALPSPQTDIYSLGVLLFFLVSGEHPIVARTLEEVRAAHRSRSYRPLRRVADTVSDAYGGVVERALHPDPALRFASASALARALADVAGDGSSSALEDLPLQNLPAPVDRFVGRRRDLAELRRLFADGTRVVTVNGAGGCGKSRLALELGRELLPTFPSGVWLVELTSLSTADDALNAVCSALGLQEEPKRPLLDTLGRYLTRKRLMLVLDNCEHMVGDVARLVTSVSRAAPGVCVLATSREPLSTPGETVFTLRPMDLPAPDMRSSDALEGVDAVALFVERARRADARFVLSDANSEAIADICRRLDGIPLALELAAVRMRGLSAQELSRRLASRFGVLESAGAERLPHHKTLRTLIDWSHDLLDEAERALLRRLSVFSGGWTLAAAEVVCAGAPIGEGRLDDLHFRLLSKSLIEMAPEVEPGTGNTRYRMLESIREYAVERLVEHGERDACDARHAAYYCELVVSEQERWAGPEQVSWLSRLEQDHANIRACCEHTISDPTHHVRAIETANALRRYWERSGRWAEGRSACERILESGVDREPSALRARVLYAASVFAKRLNDYRSARHFNEEAITMAQNLGLDELRATFSSGLGLQHHEQGEHERALELCQSAVDSHRALGLPAAARSSLLNLGAVLDRVGRLDEAAEVYQECLDIARGADDSAVVSKAVSNLGVIAARRKAFGEARRLLEEAAALDAASGARQRLAITQVNLGYVLQMQGEVAEARRVYAEALRTFQDLGNDLLALHTLDGLTYLESLAGDPRRSARLFGARRACARALGFEESAFEPVDVAAARQVLGEEGFEAEGELGAEMTLDQAIELALAPPAPGTDDT